MIDDADSYIDSEIRARAGDNLGQSRCFYGVRGSAISRLSVRIEKRRNQENCQHERNRLKTKKMDN